MTEDIFAQKGWICPKCGRVLAPSTIYCLWCCSDMKETITTGTGTIRQWDTTPITVGSGMIDSNGTGRSYFVKTSSISRDSHEKAKTEPQNCCDDCLYCETCDSKEFFWACTSKAVKKPKDEPHTNADQHVQHVGSIGSVEPTWTKEEHEAFYTFLWNVINPNEMQDYIGMFETKDEQQTDCPWK